METHNPTTCQICGRGIKSTAGVIAHHGYKRPGQGWQTASCMGARHLPYEQSCDLIPVAIASVKAYIDRTNANLEAFKVNPPAQLPYTRGSWNKVTTMIDRPEGFTINSPKTYRGNGYDSLFHAKIYDMETSVRFANNDLTYLTQRLANWKAPQAEA